MPRRPVQVAATPFGCASRRVAQSRRAAKEEDGVGNAWAPDTPRCTTITPLPFSMFSLPSVTLRLCGFARPMRASDGAAVERSAAKTDKRRTLLDDLG